MKKIFLPIFILSALLLLGGLQIVLAEQSIKITNPDSGDSFEQGSTVNIRWTHSEITDPVIIYLYKGGSTNRTIVSSTECDGSYDWSIPSGFPVGSDYQIVIQGTGSAFWTSDRSGNFSITGEGPPSGIPHINSISPTSGSSDEEVRIYGSNFNLDPRSNTAWFYEGYSRTSGATLEASATLLKVSVPYLSEGVYTVKVSSLTQSGWQESDNSVTFTIAEECPYISTGQCECIADVLIEGGCAYGHCSSDCGAYAGKSCGYPDDPACTESGQCTYPKKCTEVGQPCTALGTGWSGTSGICPTPGQTCCTLSSASTNGETTERAGVSQEGVIENPLGYERFEDLVNAIIDFIWKLGTPLAAIMFVISGIMFVTSTGNPEKVKTAKNVALYTAIGYGIIIMASGLIKVLQSLFQGS